VYPVPPDKPVNVYGDVVLVWLGTVPVGFDVKLYCAPPVTDVNVSVMVVDVPLIGVTVGTAAGRVYRALDVVVVRLVPDAFTEEIVNVYCVPALRPGNV
jgi:hypothetical protein